MKNYSVADFSENSLVDLRDVRIDTSKAVSERINEYFEQIKNPYLFKVGDLRVKLSFGDDRSFTDALQSVILAGTNYQADLS